MIVTTIALTIIGMSFKKRYGARFSYPSVLLTLIRQPFRLLDFEGTKHKMKKVDWIMLVFNQGVANIALMAVIGIMFANVKHNNKCLVFLMLFTYSCVYYNFTDFEDKFTTSSFFIFLPTTLFIIMFPFIFQRHFPRMI